jgi:hypothetical protein
MVVQLGFYCEMLKKELTMYFSGIFDNALIGYFVVFVMSQKLFYLGS